MVMIMEKPMNLNIYHWTSFTSKNRREKCKNLMDSYGTISKGLGKYFRSLRRKREELSRK